MSGQVTGVSAADLIFDNDAGTGDWGTAVNWDADLVPVADDNAFIGGAFGVTGSLIDNILNLNYSSTGASVIGDGGFAITGVLTNTSTGSVNFSGNTGGATNTGAGTITIGGGVTGRVISTGTGAIDITGQLRANGSGVRIDIDDGDVSAGTILNQGGSDALITGGSLTSAGLLRNFNNGSIIRASSGGTLNANGGIQNRFRARLQVDNGGVINVTGHIANGAGRNQQGTVLITGGTLNADSFTNHISSSWTQTGGVVNISGNANISASAMQIRGGEFNVENITRSVFNSISFTGTSVTNVRGRIRGLGGGSRGSIAVGGAAIVNVGSISNERGNAWNQSGGVVTVSGSTRNTNTSFNISGGEHHADGGFVTTNAVTVSNSGLLDIGSSGLNINAGGNAQGVARLTVRNDAVAVSTSVNNVKGVVTVSNNASLTTTTGSYTNQSNGALNVSGGMVDAQSGLFNNGTTNLSGTGNIQVTGGLGNSRTFNVTSANSTLTTDTLSNSRLFNLDAGTVNVTGNATIQTGSGQLDQDGGTFNVDGLLRTTGGGRINLDAGVLNANANMVNDGTTNLQGPGDLNLAGDLDNGGTFNVLGGLDALDIVNLTSSGLFNLDTNTVNVSGTATIASGGELDQDGGTLTVDGLLSTDSGGTVNLDAGALNANAGMANNGTTNLQGAGDLNLVGDLDNGGTFNVLGGLDAVDIVNLTSGGLFNLDTNTVNVSGTATITDGGELDQDGGTLTVDGLLSTESGGTINLDTGALNANASMVNNGTTNLQGPGDLNLVGDLDNGGVFNVLGGLDALNIVNLTSSGLFNLDTNTVNVSGTATIASGGELDQDGGTLTVDGLLSTDSGGTINLDAGALNANASMVNNGTTNLQGPGDLNLVGDLDNGGVFNVLGGLDALDIVNLTSSGLFNLDTNAVNVSGTATIKDGGELDQDGGTLNVGGLLSNESGGTINLDAGALNANANMVNDGTTNLQGPGDLNLAGDLDNGGTFNVLGGLDALDIVNLTSSGLFNLDTNTVNVSGTATIASGGELDQDGGTLNVGGLLSNESGGTINLDAGALNANASMVNNGTTNLQGPGDLNLVGDLDNGGAFNVLGGLDALDIVNLTSSGLFNLDTNTVNVSGTATIASGGELDQDGGTLNVGGLLSNESGGTINLDAGALNANANMANDGTTNLQGTGDLNLVGDLNNGGAFNVLGGLDALDIVNLTSSGLFNLDTNTVNVSGTATIENGGELDQDGGTFTVDGLLSNESGGTVNVDAGVLNANASMVNNGTANLQGTGDLNLTGDLDNGGAFNVFGGASPVDIENLTSSGLFNLDTNTVNVSGTATIKDGGELDQDGGTMNIEGLLSNESGGTINLDAGTLNANAGMVNNGTTNLQGTGDLNLVGDLDNGGAFNVLGGASPVDIVNLTSSGLFNLDTNTVNVSGTATIENGGELDQDGGTLNVGGLLSTKSGGTINLNAGALNANANMVNDGTTNLQGTGDLNLTGNLENGGAFNVLGGASPVDIENLTNSGLFNLDANTVNVSGTATIENGGELDQDGGTLNIAGLLSNESGGTINLDAGALNANAGMVNNGTTNLRGTGDLNLIGDLDNGGTFNVLGGLDALDIENLTISGLFNLDANTVNVSGTATVRDGGELDQDGGTLNVDGLLSNESGGAINVGAGVLNANAGMVNDGTTNLQGTGNLNVAGALDNRGIFNVLGVASSAATANKTSTGLFKSGVNNAKVPSATTIADGGNLTVAGLLTNESTGTINLSGGVLNANAGVANDGTINVQGTGALNLVGTLNNGGTFNVVGGTSPVNIDNVTSRGLLNLDTNTVDVTGTVTIESGGVLDQDGGTLNTTGLLSNEAGGNIDLSSGVLNANGGLTNRGTTNWNGGSLSVVGLIDNAGTFNSTVDDILKASDLRNAGVFRVNSGNLVFDFDGDFVNDGEVHVAKGASLNGENIVHRGGGLLTGDGVVNNQLALQDGSFVRGTGNGLTIVGNVSGTGSFSGRVNLNSDYRPVPGELRTIQHERTSLNGTTFLDIGNDRNNDQLIANDEFSLGGELVVTQLNGTVIDVTNTYDLIVASGSGSLVEDFENVSLPDIPLLNWIINYDDKLYQLAAERIFVGGKSATGLGLNPTQEAALNGIDDTTFTYFSENPTLAKLADEISEAVTTRDRDRAAFLSQGLTGNAIAHLPDLLDRRQQVLMDEIYHRHCPQWRRNSSPNDCRLREEQFSGASTGTDSNSSERSQSNGSRYTYVTAGVVQNSVDGQNSGALGYDGEIQNLVVGHEQEVGQNNLVGIAFAYSQLRSRAEDGFATSKASALGVVLHHEYNSEQGWDTNAMIGASLVDIREAPRRVFPGIHTTGDTEGTELFGYLEGGYKWETEEGDLIRPFARLSYTSSKLDSFVERGEGGLSFDRTDYRVLRGHLGLEYLTRWDLDNGDDLITNISMRWDRALAVRGSKVRSEFVGGGGRFDTFLVQSPDWQMTARLNLDYLVHDKLRIFGNVSTVVSDGSSHQYGLSLGVEHRF